MAGRLSDGINRRRRCRASVPALKTQTPHPLAQFVQEDVLTLTRLSTRDEVLSQEGLRGGPSLGGREAQCFLVSEQRGDRRRGGETYPQGTVGTGDTRRIRRGFCSTVTHTRVKSTKTYP